MIELEVFCVIENGEKMGKMKKKRKKAYPKVRNKVGRL